MVPPLLWERGLGGEVLLVQQQHTWNPRGCPLPWQNLAKNRHALGYNTPAGEDTLGSRRTNAMATHITISDDASSAQPLTEDEKRAIFLACDRALSGHGPQRPAETLAALAREAADTASQTTTARAR